MLVVVVVVIVYSHTTDTNFGTAIDILQFLVNFLKNIKIFCVCM